MSDTGVPEVVLYGRDGCHLCNEARKGLSALGEERSISVREVDIEADEELLHRFLERIPVVEVDGAIVCELWLDSEAVRSALGILRR